jgi:Zinc finger, C2H2 type
MAEEIRETGDVAPSMNPEDRPDLQDYKDKESANTNKCQDCNKVFSSIEELTSHYKKEHPELF